jgi:hypothetical protein
MSDFIKLGDAKTDSGQPILVAVDKAGMRVLGQSLRDALFPPDDDSRVPRLGVSRAPRTLSTRTFPVAGSATDAPTRLQISRPCLLLPIQIDTPGGALNTIDASYCPDQPASILGGSGNNYGIAGARGACYLWAPGIWYFFLFGNAGGGETVTYAIIPTDDPRLVDLLLNPQSGGRGTEGSNSIALAAATDTEIFSVRTALLSDYVRIENVGTNPMRYEWGNGNPSGAAGFSLAAGASAEFKGLSFPTARLIGHSTLGTTVQYFTQARSFQYQTE